MSFKCIKVFSLFAILGIAISCGGGSDSPAVATATSTISGTINDNAASTSSKPFSKAGDTYTAKITNLDNETQTWTATVNNREYSAQIDAGINIKIEVLSGDTVILSRVMDKAETVGTVAAVEVNSVTHVEAKMAIASYTPNGTGTMETALKGVRKEMFGSETKPTSYALNTIMTKLVEDSSFTTTIGTYSQMLSSTSADQVSELLVLANTFAVPTRTSFATTIKTYMEGTASNPTRLNLFTEAQNAAELSGVIKADLFTTARTTFNTYNPKFIETAQLNSKIPPKFGSAADSIRAAAPGVLFRYIFPKATSEGLDLKSVTFSGSWVTKPSGLSEFVTGGIGFGPTLKFIPSEGDVNKTFKYSLTIRAGNGQTASKEIDIPVKALSITHGKVFKLSDSNHPYYKPELGPILAGDYFYVVADISGEEDRYALQKYNKSDLANGDTLSLADEKKLPLGLDPETIKIAGNYAYLATDMSGIQAVDLRDLTKKLSVVAQSFTGTQLEIVNNKLYSMNNQYTIESRPLISDSLNWPLSEPLPATTVSPSLGFTPTMISSYNDYLYLASWNTAAFITNGAKSTSFTATRHIFKDQSGLLGSPLYLQAAYTDTVKALTLNNVTLEATITSLSSARSYDAEYATSNSIVNGSYLYATDRMSGVKAYSLLAKANTTTMLTGTNPTSINVSHQNAGELMSMIVNRPEGFSGSPTRAGTSLYVPAQKMSSGITYIPEVMTDSWYIKEYNLSPKQ